jgi:hypothetical protein
MVFGAVETYKKFFQTRIFGGTESGAPGRKPANDSDWTSRQTLHAGLASDLAWGGFPGNLTATQ